jgi:exosortase
MTPAGRTRWFIAGSLCLLAANVSVLRALAALVIEDQTASHIVLIPLVAFALVWQRRDAIFSSVDSALVPGTAIMAAGAAILIAGRLSIESGAHTSALSLTVGGLLVVWLGGFLAAYGWKTFAAARFPLLLLVFMVPVPAALLDPVVFFLKAGSRDTVAALFTLTGTPYHREGFVFSLPAFDIEIADECSGVRSSIALLLTSLMVGHMFLTTWWRKALLVAAILPMAVLKNGVRIVSLSLLAAHVDPGFLKGQLHHEGGIVFFLLSLAMMTPIFLFLRRSDPVRADLPQPVEHRAE